MSHVSRAELRAFVTTGVATPAFESHVEVCDDCAQRLGTLSAERLAPARTWPAVRLELVVAVAVLALAVVWPKPSATMLSPEPSFALSNDLAAGVPDAGLFIKPPLPLVVASLDAGGTR
jgi:hypothetical protein